MKLSTASPISSVPAPAKLPKLTREQARRVRELMADEGESRASAEAWIRTFEPAAAS